MGHWIADYLTVGRSRRQFRLVGALPGQQMKLVTYNIHYGFGRDGICDIERIATAVQDADIIALQEVERFWPRSGMVDQVALLAKVLPDHWVAYGPTIDIFSPAGFSGEMHTPRRQFGNATLSKYPISSQSNLLLPRGKPASQTMQRGALEVTIDSPGGPLRIYSTHLDYLSAATRRLQIDHIAHHSSEASQRGGPWVGRHAVDHDWLVGDEPRPTDRAVLLGDMNIVGSSIEHQAVLGATGLVDAWMAAGSTGTGATKDGDRIDHCWVSRPLAAAVKAAWVDEAAAGSDHQPAWFELEF